MNELVIAVIGENCTGKSTLAEKIRKERGGQIITGKDYLRLASSPFQAKKLFQEKLKNASSGEDIIYVISEKDQLDLLEDNAFRILVTADLEEIMERFRERMHGNLPKPVEDMLRRKHGMFDHIQCDFHYDGTNTDQLFAELQKEKG